MKKYDGESKKWIEEEELEKKLKKRKLCKGNREHDYILVLPPYIKHKTSLLGAEVAEDYYRIERERDELNEAKDKELQAIGINRRTGFRSNHKNYLCAVCGKREYK